MNFVRKITSYLNIFSEKFNSIYLSIKLEQLSLTALTGPAEDAIGAIYDRFPTIKKCGKMEKTEKVKNELCWRHCGLTNVNLWNRLRHFVKQFSLVFQQGPALFVALIICFCLAFSNFLIFTFDRRLLSLFHRILWDAGHFLRFFWLPLNASITQPNAKCNQTSEWIKCRSHLFYSFFKINFLKFCQFCSFD